MGASLPSAVTSTVVERQGSDAGIEGVVGLEIIGNRQDVRALRIHRYNSVGFGVQVTFSGLCSIDFDAALLYIC